MSLEHDLIDSDGRENQKLQINNTDCVHSALDKLPLHIPMKHSPRLDLKLSMPVAAIKTGGA